MDTETKQNNHVPQVQISLLELPPSAETRTKKEIRRDYQRGYQKSHLDKWRVQNKTWRDKNKKSLAKKHQQYYRANREKILAYNKQYRAQNREELLAQKRASWQKNNKNWFSSSKEGQRQYRITHREAFQMRNKKYRKSHPEKQQSYYEKNRVTLLEKNRQYRKRMKNALRVETFAAYEGAICKCCGETTFEFLSIDHINGGGRQHRKALKSKGGYHFYQWLKKNGFPPGYQVLCLQCNQAKNAYVSCPHTWISTPIDLFLTRSPLPSDPLEV